MRNIPLVFLELIVHKGQSACYGGNRGTIHVHIRSQWSLAIIKLRFKE